MAKLGFPKQEVRAKDAWRRISDKPTAITLERQGVSLASQTVRIEHNTTGREVSGGAGETAIRGVTVFGVKGHPTVNDTDIRRNDRFAIDNTIYRVADAFFTLGEVQAKAEAIS